MVKLRAENLIIIRGTKEVTVGCAVERLDRKKV